MKHVTLYDPLQIRVTSITTAVCGSVTGWGILFQMINFPLVTKADIKVAHSSFLRFQLQFTLLAALQCSSCYCSTPSDLLTCGHITNSDAMLVWPFSSYFCRFRQSLLHLSYFLLKAVDLPKFCRYLVYVSFCWALDNTGFK